MHAIFVNHLRRRHVAHIGDRQQLAVRRLRQAQRL